MQNELTARQVNAWKFCALSVPAALVLSGHGWVWVLAGSFAGWAMAAAVQRLQARSGAGATEAFRTAFGKTGGRIAATAQIVWLLLSISGAAAACQWAFEDELGALAPAISLLLAALASEKGLSAVGRVCGVLALCLTILYGVIVFAALPQIHLAWAGAWGSAQDAAISFALCLTPMAVAFAQTDKGGDGRGGMVLALFPPLLAFLTAGCLSPELVQTLRRPLLTLCKSLTVLSVMQRFEVILSAAELLGLFALLAVFVCAVKRLYASCWPKSKLQPGGGGVCLLAFGGSLVVKRLPLWLWCAGATIFWGLLPILTQVIANIKKSEK